MLSPPLKKRGLPLRTLIGTALLVALFFLPLHFHSLTPAAQLSKECGCYAGDRTQTGLAPASMDWDPNLQASPVNLQEPQVPGWFSVRSRSIRAPPELSYL